MMERQGFPVVVIGAGPIGLAAAAHLDERGLSSVVLERGSVPAAGVAEWGHVRLFSPWRLNIDETGRRLLRRQGGWDEPDSESYPTGIELRELYLLPLAKALEATGTQLSLGSNVVSVTRLGLDKLQDDRETAPFEVTFEREGQRERLLAQAVIDASGTWGSPNPLGVAGTPVPGEDEVGDRIVYGIPDVLGADRDRYAGRRTLVVGGGHSAMNVVGDLARLAGEEPGTGVLWAIRRDALSLFGEGEPENLLPQRAMLQEEARKVVESGVVEFFTRFEIEALDRSNASLVVTHPRGELVVDEIVAATGVRPSLAPLRELRLELDSVLEAPVELAPLIDPRVHSCATVPPHGSSELSHPEANFFLAGMKSYGRAPTFLMVNGYEQVRSIAAALVGESLTSADLKGPGVVSGACVCGPQQVQVVTGSSRSGGCC